MRCTELLPEPLPVTPLEILSRWMAEAWEYGYQPNPNAMVLATSGRENRPAARVVLCKQVVVQPGYLAFYTHYGSPKGRQLAENPRAAAVIHWDALHRQVRVEGPVLQAPAAESDAYFASRPWKSRVGAWASAQSEPVMTREELLKSVSAEAERFGDSSTENELGILIPRPPQWGGYHLWADSVELWVEGDARIHDRARWTRALTPRRDGCFDAGPWTATRLQP